MQTQLRWIRRILLTLSFFYFAGLTLYLILRLVVGDRHWSIGALNIFAIYYFVPLLVTVPLVMVLRARRLTMFGVILAMVASFWTTPYFVPKAAALPTGQVLRVMTFNIWAQNPDTSDIERYIRQVNPDIVALQESTAKYAQEGIATLRGQYPYQANIGYMWGNLILSRYPILSEEKIPQASQRTYSDQQRITVKVGDQTIALYNIHLSYPLLGRTRIQSPLWFIESASRYDDKPRNEQLQMLLKRLESETLPMIVMGDFNMSDQSPTYQTIAARLNDSWKEQGWGLGASWPNARKAGLPAFVPPLIRIDYIWHSNAFRVVEIKQGIALGSDHIPLIATLELRPS